MWFKRGKKSQRDDALSQSLRSLQNLLNETGRREPQLDGVDDIDADETSAGPVAELAGEAEPRLAEPASADAPPPLPGNRWRELTLSFDAEPLVPHPAEPETDADHPAPAGDALELTETAIHWEMQADEVEPALGTAPAAPSGAGLDDDANGVEPVVGTTPSVRPGAAADASQESLDMPDTAASDDQSEPAPAGEAPRSEPAPPVLSATEPPAGDAPDAELELHSLDDGTDERAMPTNAGLDAPEPAGEEAAMVELPDDVKTSEPGPAAAPTQGRGPEDQLHLQLEPTDEPGDADIPTLTQAVYVPDDPPAPVAIEPQQDTSLIKDIEGLRARLQRLELEALSAEQQARLHDGLSELLGELE